MEIHKVTDREIEICGLALERETEGCVKLAIQIQLALLMEIRNEMKKPLLQKIKEKIFGLPKVKIPKKQKVYTTPTGNKKDIIVGESCGSEQCSDCKCGDNVLDPCDDDGQPCPNCKANKEPKESVPIFKKKLKDLTEKEKSTLMNTGMFWELYPEGDGNPEATAEFLIVPEEPKIREITEGKESKGGLGTKPSGKRPEHIVGQKTKSKKKKKKGQK